MQKLKSRHIYVITAVVVALIAVTGAVILAVVGTRAGNKAAADLQREAAGPAGILIKEQPRTNPQQSAPAVAGAGPGQNETADHRAVRILHEAASGMAGAPTMVVLGTDWCRPCRKMLPVIEQLDQTYSGRVLFAYINIDDHPGIAKQYNIGEVPVQLFFNKDGKLVHRHTGFYPAENVVGRLAAMGIPKTQQAMTTAPGSGERSQ